jgi:hypothetical protein
MKSTSLILRSAATAAVVGLSSAAMAAVFPETEPNDNKTQANAVVGLTAGDSIVGNSTGTSTTVPGPASADTYLITKTTPAALGIYRNRLVLTSNTLAHTGSIRGLTQSDPGAGLPGVINPGTDSAFQTSSTVTTPPRFNQWYSFGRPSDMYYRVTGVATSTADYTATMETIPVVPTAIGNYASGQIVLNWEGQGHSTDTDMWVYDAGLNAIPLYGNDDNSIAGGGTGTGLQSRLQRVYAAGTYYIAVTNFGFANNLNSAADDDFKTGTVLDFPDKAVNSSTTTNLNLTFTISDSLGATLQVPNTKIGPYDINWFVFTVDIPEPTGLALLGLAVPMFMRRRK